MMLTDTRNAVCIESSHILAFSIHEHFDSVMRLILPLVLLISNVYESEW
jgi:hypothetical protein